MGSNGRKGDIRGQRGRKGKGQGRAGKAWKKRPAEAKLALLLLLLLTYPRAMTPSEKAPCKHSAALRSTARSNATQRDLGLLLLLLLLLLTRPPSQPSHTGANETAGKPRSHKARPILPRFPAQGAAYWTDLQGNKRTMTDPGPINLTPRWGNDHYLQTHCSSCQMDVPPQADPTLRSQLMHSYPGLGGSSELHQYEVHHESLWQPTITTYDIHGTNNNTIHWDDESLNRSHSSVPRRLLLLPPLQPRMRACGRNADLWTPLTLTYPGLSHCHSHRLADGVTD